MRSGLLAQELGSRGHQVMWWCSTFSHHHKNFIFDSDTQLELMPNVTLRALNAGCYTRNISLARLVHHRRLGRRFIELAANEPVPDLIVSALPIIDFPYQAARFATAHDRPLIIDVRDPWPDVFADKSPALFRPLVRLLTATERARSATSLCRAASITAVSKGFMRWALRLARRSQRPSDKVFYLGHSGFEKGYDEHAAAIPLSNQLNGKLVFTFVGSFGYSYEVELIARAAQYFNAQRSDISFVLVGDGHQRGTLCQKYAGLPNLILTGWLDTREIAAVLAHSQVGLVPCRSLPNTVPNKPFEYLAAGLPLISSLEGEMAEIIKSYGLGLSYRAGDLAGLIHAVGRVLQDPQALARWSANAAKAFREEFSGNQIYPAFADHVEMIAGHSRWTGPT